MKVRELIEKIKDYPESDIILTYFKGGEIQVCGEFSVNDDEDCPIILVAHD